MAAHSRSAISISPPVGTKHASLRHHDSGSDSDSRISSTRVPSGRAPVWTRASPPVSSLARSSRRPSLCASVTARKGSLGGVQRTTMCSPSSAHAAEAALFAPDGQAPRSRRSSSSARLGQGNGAQGPAHFDPATGPGSGTRTVNDFAASWLTSGAAKSTLMTSPATVRIAMLYGPPD